MNIALNYALQSGQKISKPFIAEEFYPLPFDRYITFHPFTKPSKTYDYWNEVLDIVIPKLTAAGIKVVQLGAKGEAIFKNCHPVVGDTSLNQSAFIVKNSLLHLSADTFSAHLAGMYNVPVVALYSNNYVENVKPYFGTAPKICLSPSIPDYKPSFSFDENPKTINTLKPEEIARQCLALLNIKYDFPYKNISFGRSYGQLLVEMVPICPVNLQSIGLNNIVVRMDLAFNEQILLNQLNISKAIIYTPKSINRNLILKYREKIDEVIYVVDDEQDADFVEFLRDNVVKYGLISFCDDKEKMDTMKLKFMDLGLIHKQEPQRIEKKDGLFYKSSRFIICENKIYPSTAALLADQPIPSLKSEICPVIDNEVFWKESGYFAFFEKA